MNTAALDPVDTLAVSHDAQRRRFTATVDGLDCVVDYRRQDQLVTFTHTEVPRALQGRGIAAELVRQALAWAAAEGVRVIPACSYVSVYMRRHPDTKPLLACRAPA
jgi:predicted GNAT family acetyltransferase